MINIIAIRKECSSRTYEINKDLRNHQKQLSVHQKRFSELDLLKSKSNEKIIELQQSISDSLVNGHDITSLRDSLATERLDLEAYKCAAEALHLTISGETSAIAKLKDELKVLERRERSCRLIELARVYNRQANDLSKTLHGLRELIETQGGVDQIQEVRIGGTPSGINQVLLSVNLARIYETGEHISRDQEDHFFYKAQRFIGG